MSGKIETETYCNGIEAAFVRLDLDSTRQRPESSPGATKRSSRSVFSALTRHFSSPVAAAPSVAQSSGPSLAASTAASAAPAAPLACRKSDKRVPEPTPAQNGRAQPRTLSTTPVPRAVSMVIPSSAATALPPLPRAPNTPLFTAAAGVSTSSLSGASSPVVQSSPSDSQWTLVLEQPTPCYAIETVSKSASVTQSTTGMMAAASSLAHAQEAAHLRDRDSTSVAARGVTGSLNRFDLCLPNRMAPATPIASSYICRSLNTPVSPMSPSFPSESGPRKSLKDSSDLTPGMTLKDLVDQLTVSDYVNTSEHTSRVKEFLLIYRKFLRPRELLEMFIERFEELGEFADDDDDAAKNTRQRICICLYHWLKDHPNDLSHRQTRQRVVSFLRERVGLFPCLNEIYLQLLPLSSSVNYTSSWRWSQYDLGSPDSKSPSILGPTFSAALFDEDADSGFHDAIESPTETVEDEDREWALYDEDEVHSESKTSLVLDSLIPFPQNDLLQPQVHPQIPRDRRSSTGSLSSSPPNAMVAFVASRRGSASSLSSGRSTPLFNNHVRSMTAFPDDEPKPRQPKPRIRHQSLNKRGSYRLFRPKSMTSVINITTPTRKGSSDEQPAHAFQVRPASVGSMPMIMDYSSMHLSLLEFKDTAIAEQLTCVGFDLFKKLKPRDMLRQVWKTNKGSVAFQACIAHFNFISSWVGTMILSPSKAKHRAKIMEKFIRIAKILRDMGNFNTTMAIIGAMNTSSIHRLAQTREILQGKEVWNTFKELERLMGSERSFYEYRTALKAQKLPCIPYLGVHLGDLLSISEGNRDYRQDGTIHWQKFSLLSEVISRVMRYRSEPYTIQPDSFISKIITNTRVLDDEELYIKSIGAEPGKLQHSRSLSKFTFA
ncbi:hypothetical protein BGW38_004115, partial [Lunasporangiospora selenospora]